MGQVIAIADRRPRSAPSPKRKATILDIPIRAVCTTREELCAIAHLVDADAQALRVATSMTARECAMIYFHARCAGYDVAPSAMPPIRASTLAWLDKWSDTFAHKFPLEGFTPFILNGRTTG